MQIHVSATEGVPLYLQIVTQMKYFVASGRLSPGDEVPPIRVLAEQLLINPNTVARAYRELETEGILTKRRGGSPLARRERVRILTERLDRVLAEAHQMDFKLDEVISLLEKRAGALERSGGDDAAIDTDGEPEGNT
jgi:GntR family transcriptional regulator